MSREYYAWQNARYRCHNPKAKAFHNYGARGIVMCEQWRNNFQQFLLDMGPCPIGYELDRANNEGPYCPDNCRWTDPITQHRNRRDNRIVTVDGLSLTTTEWAARTGIPHTTIHQRFKLGWDEAKAVTTPSGNGGWKHPRALTWNDQTRTIPEWSTATGLSMRRIHDRLSKGWPIDRVLSAPVRQRIYEKNITPK